MSFTLISVQTTRVTPSDTPATGNITFTLSESMTNDELIVSPSPVTGVLNDVGQLIAQNGEALVLLANDDTDTTPTEPVTNYLVTENVFGGAFRSYHVVVPHDATITDNVSTITGFPLIHLTNVLASASMVGVTTDVFSALFGGAIAIIAFDSIANTLTANIDATVTSSADVAIPNCVDLSTLTEF